MPTEIVCVDTESVGIAHDSTHYSTVGLGGSHGNPEAVESIEAVLSAMEAGEDYYVAADGAQVAVEAAECSCGAGTLGVEISPETGNPLRSLASC